MYQSAAKTIRNSAGIVIQQHNVYNLVGVPANNYCRLINIVCTEYFFMQTQLGEAQAQIRLRLSDLDSPQVPVINCAIQIAI